MSDEQVLRFFEKNGIKGEVRYYTSHGRQLRYLVAGDDSLPIILFIHGSPSSSSIFREYFRDTLFKNRFRMYAIDRPGYGGSGFGDPVTSIRLQAEMIRPILDSLNRTHHPVIIMGGSYGSSIACRLVMDNPNLADGLVLVAPALAPGREKVFWFSPLLEYPPVNWVLPRIFKSANKEKLAHEAELKKMLPLWKNIHVPVMYMQGEKDGLVYTSNAEFAKTQLTGTHFLDILFFKGRPHFIPFAERATIRLKLFQMFQMITKGK